MTQQADGTSPDEGQERTPPTALPPGWLMAFAAAGAAVGGLAGALRGRRSAKPAAATEGSVASPAIDEPRTEDDRRDGDGNAQVEAHAEVSDDARDGSAESDEEAEDVALADDATPPTGEEDRDSEPDPAPAEDQAPEPAPSPASNAEPDPAPAEQQEPDPEPAPSPTSKADDSSPRGRLGSRVLSSVKEELAEATGYEVEAVSSLRRDDGGWRLTLEVLELERIPRSTDVLASYEVVVDGDGEVLSWDRVRRYYRNQADDQGSE